MLKTTHYENTVVLVTGAGGSIGSEVCRRLLKLGVKELRMVGLTEQKLFDINRELQAIVPAGTKVVPILGSVANGPLMREATVGVDIVIHAAAHKHVPLCEQNKLEAIWNNVFGTEQLAAAAGLNSVAQFVLVSSDKAVKPVSIMGATKRACELFIKFRAARSTMKFTITRFGNVLNSAGSVLPIWREQIEKGGPITLTDARCERYFMSMESAVDLVLGAPTLPRPDGTFVYDMGAPMNMGELARQYRYDCLGRNGEKVEIVETGLRPGERLTEELHYGGELVLTKLPRVLQVKENDTGRPMKWCDFDDLTAATRKNDEAAAVAKLWEIVS